MYDANIRLLYVSKIGRRFLLVIVFIAKTANHTMARSKVWICAIIKKPITVIDIITHLPSLMLGTPFRVASKRVSRSKFAKFSSIFTYFTSFLLTFLMHVLAPSIAFSALRHAWCNSLICRDKRQARRNNLNDFYIEENKKLQTLKNNL